MDWDGIIDWVSERLKGPAPVTHVVNGVAYAILENGTLGEPVRELAPQWYPPTLTTGTLSGLVAAYRAGLDDLPVAKVAFHIVSPTRVQLISLQADVYGHRHLWGEATHRVETPFRFGQYMDSEAFLIAFRSSFFFNDNAVKIQKLLSSLTNESAVAVSDDGVSQTVTAKSGAVTRTAVELPAEIPLVPWRTFRECAPVESKFLLRLKGDPGKVPQAALFEIDAKWQLDTVEAIRKTILAKLSTAVVLA